MNHIEDTMVEQATQHQVNMNTTLANFEKRQTLTVTTLIKESEATQNDRLTQQSSFMMDKFSQILDQKFAQFTMTPSPVSVTKPQQYNPWSKRRLITPNAELDPGEHSFGDESMEFEAEEEGKSPEEE